mgnify:CR=1 FL=1
MRWRTLKDSCCKNWCPMKTALSVRLGDVAEQATRQIQVGQRHHRQQQRRHGGIDAQRQLEAVEHALDLLRRVVERHQVSPQQQQRRAKPQQRQHRRRKERYHQHGDIRPRQPFSDGHAYPSLFVGSLIIPHRERKC